MERRNILASLFAFVPALFASAKPKSCEEFIPESFDCEDWARKFIENVRANPSVSINQEQMEMWFSSALSRGYGEGRYYYDQDAMESGKTKIQMMEHEHITAAVWRGWRSEKKEQDVDWKLVRAIASELENI